MSVPTPIPQSASPNADSHDDDEAQGVYVHGGNFGLEHLEDYQAEGYHPIHLGDLLGDAGRYRVLQKLGHGGFGTAWLCLDTQHTDGSKYKYVAVKVMTADISGEKLLDFAVQELDRSSPGGEYLCVPLDHFQVRGPNGTHHCLVLPPLGPRCSPDLWKFLGEDPGEVLRKICHQATQALGFLHKNGLCHGDFRPANILVKLKNIDELSEDEIASLLGPPALRHVHKRSGDADDLPPSMPRYLVEPADLFLLGPRYLADDIRVIDFSESYRAASPPSGLGTPENYLPPEMLLGKTVGVACEIWSLGCTIFEIRRQVALFYMINETDEMLGEMVSFFGKLPEPWWSKWEARDDFCDEDGNSKEPGEDQLKAYLASKTQLTNRQGWKREFSIPEYEHDVLLDLLFKVFAYDPAKRPSVEEILEHPWFKL